MKITAAPQVFDCLLKVAKSNLIMWVMPGALSLIIHSVVLSDRSQNVLQRGCENCCKDCAAVPKIQCCKIFAPTLPHNGRSIELQRNISAILCPFGNLITLSD